MAANSPKIKVKSWWDWVKTGESSVVFPTQGTTLKPKSNLLLEMTQFFESFITRLSILTIKRPNFTTLYKTFTEKNADEGDLTFLQDSVFHILWQRIFGFLHMLTLVPSLMLAGVMIFIESLYHPLITWLQRNYSKYHPIALLIPAVIAGILALTGGISRILLWGTNLISASLRFTLHVFQSVGLVALAAIEAVVALFDTKDTYLHLQRFSHIIWKAAFDISMLFQLKDSMLWIITNKLNSGSAISVPAKKEKNTPAFPVSWPYITALVLATTAVVVFSLFTFGIGGLSAPLIPFLAKGLLAAIGPKVGAAAALAAAPVVKTVAAVIGITLVGFFTSLFSKARETLGLERNSSGSAGSPKTSKEVGGVKAYQATTGQGGAGKKQFIPEITIIKGADSSPHDDNNSSSSPDGFFPGQQQHTWHNSSSHENPSDAQESTSDAAATATAGKGPSNSQ